MLDRCVALARRERDVLGGDVVLQVDESFAAATRRWNAPQRERSGADFHFRMRWSCRGKIGACRAQSRRVAIGKRFGEAEAPVCCASGDHM